MGRCIACVIGRAKTAELIELPFVMVSRVSSRNRVLDGRVHWRHLAITVERLCEAASDAACSKLLRAILFTIGLRHGGGRHIGNKDNHIY